MIETKFSNRLKLWSTRARIGLKVIRSGARMILPFSRVIATSVSTRELRRMSVFSTLLSELNFKHDAVIESHLHRLTKKIDEIYNPPHEVPKEISGKERVLLLRQVFDEFAFVAGEIARWELEIKLFAEVMGIEVIKSSSPKSRQSLIDFRDLEPIIDEVSRLAPALNLNLSRLRRIRNNFSHGNLYSASKLMTAQMRKQSRDKYKAGVAVISLTGTFEPVSVNLGMSQNDASALQNFPWDLEVIGSGICKDICKEFHSSLDRISALANFKSWCQGENLDLFDLLCTKGMKLTAEDIDRLEARNTSFSRHTIELSVKLLESIRKPQKPQKPASK